ncbi:LLM class flavin-dependent oxidoreductase [Nonomuraea sp. NPDC049709]|uniref:LLM class flavin-dependent oxidoreductase n=1 Tax=Nonomuraea sp. NPDC049709 TaxID=3154736 RepID=UPI0034385746
METVAWDGTATPRPEVHAVRGAARGGVPVPLSILDLVTVSAGSTAVEAVRTSTELAGLAEHLGYHRMWVAEHHSTPDIGSSSPAVLLAHLAARTTTSRLGAGGVMLPNHPPLVVAEQFGTLEALHPGRFDLGIGRAPGTGPAAMAALRRSPAEFDQQLDELLGFLDGDPFAGVHAVPGPIQAGAAGGTGEVSRPPVWILGSSERGARLAGRRGLPFALAYHLEPGNLATALRAYRDAFRPSATLAEPYAIVSVWVVAAETRRQAERLMRPVGLGVLRMTQGVPSLVPSPEEAERYPYTDSLRGSPGSGHRPYRVRCFTRWRMPVCWRRGC